MKKNLSKAMIQQMKINPKDIWTRQFDSNTNQTVREVLQLKNGLICYVGTVSVSSSRLFQIQLHNSIRIDDNYLKRFHGVEVRVLPENEEFNVITIILSDLDLIDIFSMFIEDLIIDLEHVEVIADVPMSVNAKINNWARLFARISGQILSREAQRGLFGELTVLFDFLKHSSDKIKCVSCWTGSEGTNQDFSFENTALEIKTTMGTVPSINISNELQLDWTALTNLYLGIIHVDELNKGESTLEKLILSIKNSIKDQPDSLRLFEMKLERIGIPSGEEKNYDKIGYATRSKKFYTVKKGFPVLINSVINNPPIHHVKYQLDVSALEEFLTDFDNIKTTFI